MLIFFPFTETTESFVKKNNLAKPNKKPDFYFKPHFCSSKSWFNVDNWQIFFSIYVTNINAENSAVGQDSDLGS